MDEMSALGLKVCWKKDWEFFEVFWIGIMRLMILD
jgi:hypothetical protein